MANEPTSGTHKHFNLVLYKSHCTLINCNLASEAFSIRFSIVLQFMSTITQNCCTLPVILFYSTGLTIITIEPTTSSIILSYCIHSTSRIKFKCAEDLVLNAFAHRYKLIWISQANAVYVAIVACVSGDSIGRKFNIRRNCWWLYNNRWRQVSCVRLSEPYFNCNIHYCRQILNRWWKHVRSRK